MSVHGVEGGELGAFWHLEDGTECSVSRFDDAWILWLRRGGTLLRYQTFDHSVDVIKTAQRWRREEDPSFRS